MKKKVKKKKEPQNWWKCSQCGYVLQAAAAPEACSSCKQKCAFIDATCYTPDCGGPGNLDPQILQSKR